MSATPAADPAKTWDADHHEASWAVMGMLTALMEAGGYLPTQELGARADVPRDTARRILRTLERRGWTRREVVEGRDLWTVGPELPRIGLQYQELLNRRARALRTDFDALSAPFKATP